MAKLAHWFTIGAASAILLVTGCSSPSTSNSATQPANEAETAATETAESAESTEADETATASPNGEKPSSRPIEGVTLPPGSDPLAIVFAARQPGSEPAGTELIKVAYPTPERAIVTITKTGLLDDSVAAIRTRYDFRPVEGSAEAAKQWRLVQVTEQNKCQPNRGSQDWTGDLCQ
jgi:hypothetical protein